MKNDVAYRRALLRTTATFLPPCVPIVEIHSGRGYVVHIVNEFSGVEKEGDGNAVFAEIQIAEALIRMSAHVNVLSIACDGRELDFKPENKG